MTVNFNPSRRRTSSAGGWSQNVKLDSETSRKLDQAGAYFQGKTEELEEEAASGMTKLLIRRRSLATVNPFVRRRTSYMRLEDTAQRSRAVRFKNAAVKALELERLNQAKQRISFPYVGFADSAIAERAESSFSEHSRHTPGPQRRRLTSFRKVAKAVLIVIKACTAVRELLINSVRGERWMLVMDNVLMNATLERGKRQIFKAKYTDEDSRDLLEVSFDANLFRRDFISEEALSVRTKAALERIPGTRTPEEIRDILRCMRTVSADFRTYPRDVQRRLCECAFFDKFARGRVIIQHGLAPDGFYFVLTGTVAEQTSDNRDPRLLTVGSKFGEQDLICGCRRRTTAVARTCVELLYIHRQDYGGIFNISSATATTQELRAVMRHPVFAQFPIHRLIENPGTWNIVSYKVNQLIAENSNKVDWIYVVQHGQARVLRSMETRFVDVPRTPQNADPDEGIAERLLDFESVIHATPELPVIRRLLTTKSVLSYCPFSSPSEVETEARMREITCGLRTRCHGKFPITSSRPRTSPGCLASPRVTHMVPVPPFLQLEQLGPGQTFGLRACLPEEERGPSCSLVSGGCTMLLINRRYFNSHLDTFMTGMIRLYIKAFSTESEVLQNLNSNLMWEDFKGNTLRFSVDRVQLRREAKLKKVAGT